MSVAAIILLTWSCLSFVAVGVSLYLLFIKAGQKGVYALIPLYNCSMTRKITASRAPVTGAVVSFLMALLGIVIYNWLAPQFTDKGRLILSLAPFIASLLVTSAITCANMAEVFGKPDLFGVGMFFLPFVFWPLLACGATYYQMELPASDLPEDWKSMKDHVSGGARGALDAVKGIRDREPSDRGLRAWGRAFVSGLLGRDFSQLDFLYLPRVGKWMYKLGCFLHNIPLHIWGGIKKLGLFIWNRVILGIGRFFKNIVHYFVDGSMKTRISYLVMGYGSFARGQWLRGLLFFVFQTVFNVYMFFPSEDFSGLYFLSKLPTLGTWRTTKANRVTTYGDNSFQIMLYGVLTIFFVIAFIYTWYTNVRQNRINDEIERSGRKVRGTRDDLRSMADEQFHKTLLALPTAGVAVFTILPIFFMILVAFTNFDRNHQPPQNLFTWVSWDNFYDMLTTRKMEGVESETLSFGMAKDFDGLTLRARITDDKYVEEPQWTQVDPPDLSEDAPEGEGISASALRTDLSAIADQTAAMDKKLRAVGESDGLGFGMVAELIRALVPQLTEENFADATKNDAINTQLITIAKEQADAWNRLTEHNKSHIRYTEPMQLNLLGWSGMNLDQIPLVEAGRLNEPAEGEDNALRTRYISQLSSYKKDFTTLQEQFLKLDAQLKEDGVEDGLGCAALAERAGKAAELLSDKTLKAMTGEELAALGRELADIGGAQKALGGKLSGRGAWFFTLASAGTDTRQMLIENRQPARLKAELASGESCLWEAQIKGTSIWTRADKITGGLGETFKKVLIWTLVWAFFATFLNYFLGMLVAIMINKKGIRLKKVWRTILVMTIAIPQFVSLLYVSKMFGADGLINSALKNWGWISGSLPFWTKANWAQATIIFINIWIGIPYLMLIATGILMNIPADLYESARIDGANGFQMYKKITLPYMLFVTGPYLLTSFTGNINNFNVIYLLSGGGPTSMDLAENAGGTDLLITWLYKMTVNNTNYKMAAVVGILVFVVTAVINLIVYNMIPSVKNEEDFQ